MTDASRALPRIKVCGVGRESDVRLLAAAGVDAVGFNLVAASPRSISIERAAELCDVAGDLGLTRVAVVMDPAGEELRGWLDTAAFDFVQLHGREAPEITQYCAGTDVIKALSWSGRTAEVELVEAWSDYDRSIASAPSPVQAQHQETGPTPASADRRARLRGFLVDAFAPAQGGGTGRVADWGLLQPRPAQLAWVPLILAGGLTAENVAAAIRATAADGVDTASGVEEAPGRKSAARVQAFASNARRAWRELEA